MFKRALDRDTVSILLLVMLGMAGLQPVVASQDGDVEARPAEAVVADGQDRESGEAPLEQTIARCVQILLEMQEGDDRAEWPYEGVYRVQRRIPIGYRIGGTGICALALIQAPGFEDDSQRRAAVERATRFIVDGIEEPLMSYTVTANYDVRGWGYAYGLHFLAALERDDLVPDGMDEAINGAIRFYIDGIAATEIPERGGWNYARRRGFDQPGSPSPFMTGSTLQALFLAASQGHEIDDAMVDRGLSALERSRSASGYFTYSGAPRDDRASGVPGAVGRMLIGETTLYLAGRSTVADIRGALDAFIVHWDWLDARRAKTGTHKPPYGVAPYYFYFAHYYAAQAIEFLPQGEREEYRRRFNELLFSVQLDEGGWNDRVFPRSENYGTAMAMMALMMADSPPVPTWSNASK